MEGPGCRASEGSGSPFLSSAVFSCPLLSWPPVVWAPRSSGWPHIRAGLAGMRGGQAAHHL